MRLSTVHVTAAGSVLLAALASGVANGKAPEQRWLGVRHDPPTDVAGYFRTLTMSKWHVDGEDVFSPDFGSDRRKIVSTVSWLPGDWHFFGEAGANEPRAAMRIELPTKAPYSVGAWVYCAGEDCARIDRELAAMSAPRVTGDPQLVDEWRAIVAMEPCDSHLPLARPPVRYPPEELRREISGVATLELFYNKCGVVRDAILKISSGNRGLDRAAVNGVLRWRIAPRVKNHSGWQTERIEFHLDDPNNPAINAIDVQPEDAAPATAHPGVR